MISILSLISVFIKLSGCPDFITPQTVEAIIMVESSWDQSAESKWGAVGLMQITPVAVEDYNRRRGSGVTMDNVRRETVINLMVGIDHFCQWDDLGKRGMVIAYFTGRSRYLQMKRGQADYLRRVVDSYYEKVAEIENSILLAKNN